MSRESSGVIYTHAGPEIGVASTKTFTCQVTALLLLAIALGVRNKHLTQSAATQLHQEITQLPFLIKRILAEEETLARLAERFDDRASALYVGRGILHPLAVEGALKLKEISYIHAEAYPAGELKHGAIALIDSQMPVVALAAKGTLYPRVLSAIQEIKARDGMVIAVSTGGDNKLASLVDEVFCVPETREILSPILMGVPLQLLAYHIARRRDCPIDKPRNLAKSVTVE
jgi:glucosamine--fructose-6-phosphate aminotransferase (isomerizing)